MMSETYTLVDDLAGLIGTIQPDTIVSRTFHKANGLKGVLFGFGAGQALSEHTSSHAAMIQILSGEAEVTLGDDRHQLAAGAWVHMPPRMKHSVYAKTPLTMLLLMLTTE